MHVTLHCVFLLACMMLCPCGEFQILVNFIYKQACFMCHFKDLFLMSTCEALEVFFSFLVLSACLFCFIFLSFFFFCFSILMKLQY